MASTWHRVLDTGLAWSGTKQHALICSVSSGQTILRTRFNWGFTGVATTNVDGLSMSQNWCVAGMVTTVGNGTEAVPDPETQSGDQSPPTQRWLWWETKVPQVVTFDATNEISWWQSSANLQPPDSHGQVLATGIPGGDALNLWFSWKSLASWDDTGSAELWLSAVVLVKT